MTSPAWRSAPVAPRTPQPKSAMNGMAVASLVSAFVFPPLAIVLGHTALGEINTRQQRGRSIAVLGLVLGYAFTIPIAVVLILLLRRHLNWFDWAVIAIALIAAASGWRSGAMGSVMSFVGVVLG